MILWLTLWLAGCSEDAARNDAGGDADADVDADTDSDSDGGSDADTDGDTDTLGTDSGSETASDSASDSESDSDTSPCDPDDVVPPAMVLGAGNGAFEPLECEAAVQIYTGPQGCCHFVGGVKVDGIATDPPVRYAYQVVDDEGTEWATYGPGELIDPDDWIAVPGEDGWTAIWERWIIMSLSGPEDVEGRVVTATVRIVDDDGVEHFDSHRVTPFYVR